MQGVSRRCFVRFTVSEKYLARGGPVDRPLACQLMLDRYAGSLRRETTMTGETIATILSLLGIVLACVFIFTRSDNRFEYLDATDDDSDDEVVRQAYSSRHDVFLPVAAGVMAAAAVDAHDTSSASDAVASDGGGDFDAGGDF